jgi:hypothetical protein
MYLQTNKTKQNKTKFSDPFEIASTSTSDGIEDLSRGTPFAHSKHNKTAIKSMEMNDVMV